VKTEDIAKFQTEGRGLGDGVGADDSRSAASAVLDDEVLAEAGRAGQAWSYARCMCDRFAR
jgi:hypothetical protein